MSLVFLLTGCTIDRDLLNKLTLGVSDRILNEDLSEEKHYVIEAVFGEDEWYESIVYSEEEYYMDEYEIFSVTELWGKEDEGDIMLSWNGHRFGYIDTYYSYSALSPDFIYETRLGYVYFHKNYDYMTDVFKVEGTDLNVSFSDFVDIENEARDALFGVKGTEITLISQTNTRIKCNIRLYKSGDLWYSYGGNYPFYVRELAPEIVQTLKTNGILE